MARKPCNDYTVEPGRGIYYKGAPFISIKREDPTEPSTADTMTRKIVSMLNAKCVKPSRYSSKSRSRSR